MNLFLFDEPFESRRIAFASDFGKHLHDILKVTPGTTVYVGFVGGLRALCRVDEVTDQDCLLRVERTESSPPLLPLTLCVALPRPHSARKLLYDAAMMGVGALVFFPAERGEPSYRNSRLWTSDEWRERIQAGLEQSFCTLPPVVHHADTLADAIASISAGKLAALDNYEASEGLAEWLLRHRSESMPHWTLFIGPERGWTAKERDALRKLDIPLLHIGPRVLRVESAALAAVALLAGVTGYRAGCG
jgi:16S rRNA (uracil1498-N3)-methyltransferase